MEIPSGYEAETAWLLWIRLVLAGTRLEEAVAHDTSFPSGWGSWELVWSMRKLSALPQMEALLYFWLLSWLITLQFLA